MDVTISSFRMGLCWAPRSTSPSHRGLGYSAVGGSTTVLPIGTVDATYFWISVASAMPVAVARPMREQSRLPGRLFDIYHAENPRLWMEDGAWAVDRW